MTTSWVTSGRPLRRCEIRKGIVFTVFEIWIERYHKSRWDKRRHRSHGMVRMSHIGRSGIWFLPKSHIFVGRSVPIINLVLKIFGVALPGFWIKGGVRWPADLGLDYLGAPPKDPPKLGCYLLPAQLCNLHVIPIKAVKQWGMWM